ncbi:MAG: NAD-dependent epimerase/dehydratase family protein, partial [Actinomycetota bacterium]
TGGAGYIGSHVVDRLLTLGHAVTVLDDLSTGNVANLARSRSEINFVENSILNEKLVNKLVRRADTVFHLAAGVGVGHIVEKPLAALITNTRGAENVIEASVKHDKRLLLASTSEIYGKTSTMPMSEDDDRVLGSTTVPRWGYSTAKAIDEHLALAYAQHGLRMSVVRYFNSFGPRLDPRGYGSVVANLMRQALDNEPLTVHGNGTQTRCFTYIDDTVEGTLRAGLDEKAEGIIFNIGNDHETSINELASLVIEMTGSRSTVRHVSYEERYGKGFEDTKRRVPDVRRAATVLGFRATVELRDGLARTLQWWRQTHQ